jgi:hypothetical protein
LNSPTAILASVLLVGLAAPASAGDLLDTRLSLVFADDNIFAGPGQTTPNSPSALFGGSQNNTQFYDNYNTATTGFESMSNLVLYAKSPSFFQGLETEAALAIRLLQLRSGGLQLRDESSWVRLAWRPTGWSEGENLELIGFPVSANRFRLGYLYRISWGGDSVFGARAYRNGVPGVKLQLNRENWSVFVGGKSALMLDDVITEESTEYGALVGGGWQMLPFLRLDVGGGYFQKGKIPSLAKRGVDADVDALGASARLSLHVREPVSQSVDMQLYRNDPDLMKVAFGRQFYPGGLSYNVSVEGTRLAQTLEDPDVFGRIKEQPAESFAVQGRVTYNYVRMHALAVYRSLSFVQFDVPGFPPYTDFPQGTKIQPEMFFAVGGSYHFPGLHLTPGFTVGLQQPAAMTSPEATLGGNNPNPLQDATGRAVVVRNPGDFSVLPAGTAPLPIISAKSSTRWDLSETFATLGEVYWTRDPNRATFIKGLDGTTQQHFEDEDRLGFNLIVQARF